MFVNIVQFPPVRKGKDERQTAWEKVEPLLEGSPTPGFYEVIITSENK